MYVDSPLGRHLKLVAYLGFKMEYDFIFILQISQIMFLLLTNKTQRNQD